MQLFAFILLTTDFPLNNAGYKIQSTGIPLVLRTRTIKTNAQHYCLMDINFYSFQQTLHVDNTFGRRFTKVLRTTTAINLFFPCYQFFWFFLPGYYTALLLLKIISYHSHVLMNRTYQDLLFRSTTSITEEF